MTPPKPFDTQHFLRLLRAEGCELGEPFAYAFTQPSTNDAAKQAIVAGAGHGSTFLADEQSAGRGRRGRTWHAAAGEALLFSTVIEPRLPAERLSCITLAVGLGVRNALSRHTEAALGVKWPNDILSSGKKLAGILVEGEVAGQRARLVAGVGINVSTARFPDELQSTATSLLSLGTAPPREVLLVDVLREISRQLGLLQRGELFTITQELAKHDALRNKRISVEGEQGIARGIDSNGCLLLEVDGSMRGIGAGTVEIL